MSRLLAVARLGGPGWMAPDPLARPAPLFRNASMDDRAILVLMMTIGAIMVASVLLHR
jgi:hypothetical protein